MKNAMKKIHILFLIIGIAILFPISSSLADEKAAAGQCSGPQPCSSLPNRCVAQKNKNGQYAQTSSSNVVCGNCVKENTKNGCFLSNPTSASGSYSGLGYRPNGAGGNATPRNHYGADIGGGGKTDILVYAAADGVVSYVNTSGCGGRTIAITHTKGCTGGGAYTTIYRHLFKYAVSKGQSVKKGDVIGIEGGSNAASPGATPCDSSKQSGTRAGCSAVLKKCPGEDGGAYDIHLHFEVIDDLDLNKCSSCGTAIGSKKVLHPDCGGLQVLCGKCDVNLGELCNGEKNCHADDGNSADPNDAMYGKTAEVDSQGNPSDGCRFGDYLNSDSCVFCRMFKTIFNAASEIAYIANYKFSEPTKDLVIIGFCIWIALYLLKQVTSASKQSTGEMLKGILFQGFRVAVVVLILGGAMYEVMNVTLTPVLQTGFNFANILNNVMDEAAEKGCDLTADYMQNIQGYDEESGFPDIKGTLGGEGDAAKGAKIGALPKQIGQSIICGIKKMEDSTGYLMSLGKYSSCVAWGRHKWAEVMPHLGYLSTGIVLWLAGALLLLAVPWFLVDCILQFCVAAALLPCAIGAYAFKITSKYLKKIWDLFMNAMFNFVFMSVIMYVINSNLNSWIGYTPGTAPDEHIFVTALSPEGLAWWGIGALKIGLIMLLSWTFFGEAKELASKFANDLGLGIGQKVGGTAGSIAKQAGLTGGKAGQAALRGAASLGRSAGQGIHALGAGMNLRNGLTMSALQRLPGSKTTTNADGSTTVSHNFSLFGFSRQVSATQDANGNVSRTSTTSFSGNRFINSRERTTTNDGYTTVTERRDKNGNIISRQTSIGDIQLLTKNDGTTDMNAYNHIMNTSTNKTQTAEAMVMQHLKQRGMSIDSQAANRQTTLNQDDSITITQTNTDGSTTILNAKMVGNQMVINNQTTDKQGNILRTLSNGIQTKTERLTRLKNGGYQVQTNYAFSDYINKINRTHPPLSANGTWGISINRDQAMAGFTQQDFDNHLRQLNGDNKPKTITDPNDVQNMLQSAVGTAQARTLAAAPAAPSEFDQSQISHGKYLLNQLNADGSTTAINLQIASMDAGELNSLAKALDQNPNTQHHDQIKERMDRAITQEFDRVTPEKLQAMDENNLFAIIQLADRRRNSGDNRADNIINQALSVASEKQKYQLLSSQGTSAQLRAQIHQSLEEERLTRGQAILDALSEDGQSLQQQVEALDMNGLLSLSNAVGADQNQSKGQKTQLLKNVLGDVLGHRLHNLSSDKNALSQMSPQELAAATLLADGMRQNPDGTPNVEAMDVITRSISSLDANQKASMIMTDTISEALSKELMGGHERSENDLTESLFSAGRKAMDGSLLDEEKEKLKRDDDDIFNFFNDDDASDARSEEDEPSQESEDEPRQEAEQQPAEEPEPRQEQEVKPQEQASQTEQNPLIEANRDKYKELKAQIESAKKLLEIISGTPNAENQQAMQDRLNSLNSEMDKLHDLLGDDFKKLGG